MVNNEPGIEKPKGAIWKEEAILEDVISRVAEKVDALERQLSPLLRLRSEVPEETGKEPKLLPDFAQRLRTRTHGVKEIESRLGSLLERLEL